MALEKASDRQQLVRTPLGTRDQLLTLSDGRRHTPNTRPNKAKWKVATRARRYVNNVHLMNTVAVKANSCTPSGIHPSCERHFLVTNPADI